MTKFLEVLEHKNVVCEEILTHLEKRYLPTVDYEKRKVVDKYRAFKRENRSLLDAYKAFQQLELECSKFSFEPGIEMNIAQLQSLILPEEKVMFRLYVENETKSYQQEYPLCTDQLEIEEAAVRRAIENFGKEYEDRELSAKRQESGMFAGNTFARKGDRKSQNRNGDSDHKNQSNSKAKGRSSKNFRSGHPARESQEKDEKICKFCNQSCKAVKGGKKEQCYAWGKECKACGKKGHYATVCKSQKNVANVTQAGGGSNKGDSGASGSRNETGF